MGETISLQDLLKIIKERWILIISFAIIGIGIAIVFNSYILTTNYLAQTQILVNQKADNEATYSWNQIEAELQLINTYNDVITSPLILNKVREELQLERTTEQLSYQIKLSSESESKVLYIEVVDSDPELAVNIANTTVEIFKEEIPTLMNIDNINVLSKASLSDNPIPVSPNKGLNLVTGAVIGTLLGIGWAFLLEILDTTIKNEKDVKGISDVPVIGIVGSIQLGKGREYSLESNKVGDIGDV